jgi:hypothetical protein
MTTEELRIRLVTAIDNLLGKPMLIPLSKEDRGIFSSLRGYASVMTIYELERLSAFVVQADQAESTKQPE